MDKCTRRDAVRLRDELNVLVLLEASIARGIWLDQPTRNRLIASRGRIRHYAATGRFW